MKIIPGVASLTQPFESSVLTIGNFDGMHLGHRELIRKTLVRAHATNSPAVVMTFEPHPVKVLYPERALKRIFDLDDQRRELQALGVDVLVVEPFSREFSQLDPGRFIRQWVWEPFHPQLLVVGHDFSFGANKAGTTTWLRTEAARFGFDLDVVAAVTVEGKPVSSSRVREALQAGHVRQTQMLLGRRFYLEGIVEKGAGRGRQIGVPTANLHTAAELVPAQGVYAAWAVLPGGERRAAAVNIGRNPTFQDGQGVPLSIEAHLIGYTGDLYGLHLRLEFVEYLREERRFESKDALVAQIRRDIKTAQARLAAADAGGNGG